MRYLIILLLIPSLLKAQSKAYNKDSTVWVETNDPRIKLLYHSAGADSTILVSTKITVDYVDEPAKFDTLGAWHLVSDTSKSWNPVSAMYLDEVIKYKPFVNYNRRTKEQETFWIEPQHFKWLDSKKKTFYLKVWQ